MEVADFQTLIDENITALDVGSALPVESRFGYVAYTVDTFESFVSPNQVPEGILNAPHFLTAMGFADDLVIIDRDYVGSVHNLYLDNEAWGGLTALLADAVTYLHCFAVTDEFDVVTVYFVGVFTDDTGSWAVGAKSVAT